MSDRGRLGDGAESGDSAVTLPSAAVSEALAHPRRRVVLSVLDGGEQRSLADLAREVAGRETGATTDDVPEEEHRAVLATLHHAHLPKLAAADLVEWDRERDAVGAEHTALETPAVRKAIEGATGARDETWDAAVPALAAPRRRAVLAVLVDADRQLAVDELAERVAALANEPVEQTRTALVHAALPALAAAGLVEYDDRTVAAADHPVLEWDLGRRDGDLRDRPAGRDQVDVAPRLSF